MGLGTSLDIHSEITFYGSTHGVTIKTKFPTVYLTIYPPKLKFWIQLCPKYMADLFHLFAYWCLLLTTFANHTFWTQIRPNKMLGLIWIQNVWHSDDIPDFFNFFFLKKLILEKNQHTTKTQARFLSMLHLSQQEKRASNISGLR